jgi:sec-independent protein translocase protein TatA
MFGNLGMWEILLILLLVLLLFGAKRIPEIAGSMGKGIREFKRNITDVERAFKEVDQPPAMEQRRPAEPLASPAPESAPSSRDREEPKRLLG